MKYYRSRLRKIHAALFIKNCLINMKTNHFGEKQRTAAKRNVFFTLHSKFTGNSLIIGGCPQTAQAKLKVIVFVLLFASIVVTNTTGLEYKRQRFSFNLHSFHVLFTTPSQT